MRPGWLRQRSYLCSNGGMERLGHWWNGSWGRLARRDVFLYADAGRWLVQAREGGADGRSLCWTYPAEPDARAQVARLLAVGTGWRSLD